MHAETIELKATQHPEELDWMTITGRAFITSGSNPGEYTYLDDIEFYRPCDQDSICWPASGQICPVIGSGGPPAAPLTITDIQNANALELKIYAASGALLVDTTFTNNNGLPDFYWPGEILANGGVASGTYIYDLTLSNKCGSLHQSQSFTVLNGVYTAIDPWQDSTSNWTEVPVPCCLRT